MSEKGFGTEDQNPDLFLARSCVHYLGTIDFETCIDNIKDCYPTSFELKEWLKSYLLYDYAVRDWGHHFCKAKAQQGIKDSAGGCAALKVLAVGILSDGGAEADRMDDSGLTALHYAAQKEHLEVARVLLDCGATLDVLTNEYFHDKKTHLEGPHSNFFNVLRTEYYSEVPPYPATDFYVQYQC
ncbi:hypothetical protein QBC36DRAFT_303466 [Triangularia setosa]|uniref:Ankyrin repeat protein n=1 Tax=Triangularia setosa TaxID=2587417 RepID=A0AAN6W3K2_9PEZI|nr:hypothetical protein QBC36DRAFT_303466 [Podospora setosa]